MQVVEEIEVEESYVLGNDMGGRGREYKVAMRFSDPAKYPPEAHLQYEEVQSLHAPCITSSLQLSDLHMTVKGQESSGGVSLLYLSLMPSW